MAEFPKLEQSILAIFSPTASNKERHFAHTYIDEFKKTTDKIEAVGYKIAKGSDLFIRYTGLQFVEHALCYQCSSSQYDRVYSIKKETCNFLEKVIKPENEENIVLVQVSRILVELAKRLWPSYWDNMLQYIQEASMLGVCQREIGILTLKGLGEDILTLENISTKERKKQMMAELRNCVENIANFLKANMQLPHSRIVWLSIEALCPYLSWMPLPGLFVSSPSSPNICEMLFEALSRDDLRNSAVECFKVIVTRKDAWSNQVDVRKGVVSWFFSHMNSFSHVLLKSRASLLEADDAVEYTFLKSLCLTVAEMGNTLLLGCWKISEPTPPPNFMAYLELACHLLSFESMIVSTSACMLWSELFAKYSHLGDVKQCIPKLLPVFHKSLSKQVARYSVYDFTDSIETNLNLSTFKSHHQALLQSINMIDPLLVKEHLFGWMKEMLSMAQYAGPNLSQQSPEVIEWTAFITFLETWQKCLAQNPTNPEASIWGLEALKQLVNIKCQNAWILWYVLKSWSVLHVYAFLEGAVIDSLLHKMSDLVVFVPLGEDMHFFSKSTLHVRRTSLNGLTKICSTFSKELNNAGLTEKLMQYYLRLLSQNVLRMGEKPGFVECLSYLCHCYLDDDKWRENLDLLLGSELADLESTHIAGVFQNGASLARYLHLHLDPADPGYAEGKLCRAKLASAVSSCTSIVKAFSGVQMNLRNDKVYVECLTKRQDFIFQSFVRRPLVIFLPLIKCLYELWSPSGTEVLSDPLKALSHQYHPFELDIILGSANPNSDLKETGEEIEHVRIGLSMLYEQCVTFIENGILSCKHQFFCIKDAAKVVGGVVFVHGMDPYRLKVALNVCYGMIVASSKARSVEIGEFLWNALNMTLKVLDDRYAIIYDRRATLNESSSSETKNEVLYERLSSLIAREYLKCLEAYLLTNIAEKEEHSTQGDQSGEELLLQSRKQEEIDLSEFGFGGICLTSLSKEMLIQKLPLLQWASHPLVWDDLHFAIKAAKICALLYVQYNSFGEVDTELMEDLFIHVLESLRIHGEHPESNTILNLAYLIYFTSMESQEINLKKIFGQKTGLSVLQIKTMDQELSDLKGKKGKDKFKEAVKSLKTIPLSEIYKNKQFISKLPEVQCMTGDAASTTNEEVYDLSALFDN